MSIKLVNLTRHLSKRFPRRVKLRSGQNVSFEGKQAQAEAQRANQPKWWHMVLLVGGAFALWYYYTEHVVHLSDFENMRKEYVATRPPKKHAAVDGSSITRLLNNFTHNDVDFSS